MASTFLGNGLGLANLMGMADNTDSSRQFTYTSRDGLASALTNRQHAAIFGGLSYATQQHIKVPAYDIEDEDEQVTSVPKDILSRLRQETKEFIGGRTIKAVS